MSCYWHKLILILSTIHYFVFQNLSSALIAEGGDTRIKSVPHPALTYRRIRGVLAAVVGTMTVGRVVAHTLWLCNFFNCVN